MDDLDLRCPCCGSLDVEHDHRATSSVFRCGACGCASDGTVGTEHGAPSVDPKEN